MRIWEKNWLRHNDIALYLAWKIITSGAAFRDKMICGFPDSKVHGANMGPTWGRQDPGGSHVGHMNLAIWVVLKMPISPECITSPQILWSLKMHSWSIGMRRVIPSSCIGNHQSKISTDWSYFLVSLLNTWFIVVRYVALCHYSWMIGIINNTYNLWWSNQELSICPLERVQNRLSDYRKLRKITIWK